MQIHYHCKSTLWWSWSRKELNWSLTLITSTSYGVAPIAVNTSINRRPLNNFPSLFFLHMNNDGVRAFFLNKKNYEMTKIVRRDKGEWATNWFRSANVVNRDKTSTMIASRTAIEMRDARQSCISRCWVHDVNYVQSDLLIGLLANTDSIDWWAFNGWRSAKAQIPHGFVMFLESSICCCLFRFLLLQSSANKTIQWIRTKFNYVESLKLTINMRSSRLLGKIWTTSSATFAYFAFLINWIIKYIRCLATVSTLIDEKELVHNDVISVLLSERECTEYSTLAPAALN